MKRDLDHREKWDEESYGSDPRASFGWPEEMHGNLFWLFVAVVFIALFLVVMFWPLGGPGAKAHEAMSGWRYPASCCADRDCWQLPEGAVRETAGGFVLAGNGEFIPHAEAKVSGDGKYHLCRNPGGVRLCFFYPPKGF